MSEKRQEFGSVWTENKLDAVEDYLKAYVSIMKNQDWARLLYIDAFAGSGDITLKGGRIVDGSAIRALKYPFERYYFFDSSMSYLESLRTRVESEYPGKAGKARYVNQDSNILLETIDSVEWKKEGWRGVIFLDPFAMQLNWSSLEHIAKTEIFDVWYWFPLKALNRMLVKTGKIGESWQKKITVVLGTDEWKEQIYRDSPQQSIFDESDKVKLTIEELRAYIISRLQTIFPTVSKKAVIFRNSMNAPMFLLCFMGSNPSKAAQKASLSVADHLLSKL